MADAKMVRHVLNNWSLEGTLEDLSKQPWSKTEPKRIDRWVYMASAETAKREARRAVTKKEWAEAAKEGFEHEIVEEYMEALGEVLTRIMGSHVYVSLEEAGWVAGQYEDGDIEELRAAGYEIVDD